MSGRVFVHVGTPKTGTTYLQAVIWSNRALLAERGVLLPGRSLREHFQASADVRGRPARIRMPERADGAWARLVEESRGHRGDVLISHELFADAPRERAEEALAGFAEAGFEPHVVVTLRDMGRQLPAEWQERIKHRGLIGFEGFMNGVRDPESRVGRHVRGLHDPADILGRWAARLPAERVHVVTVPRPGASRTLLWERFAEAVGLDPDGVALDVPRENSSLGLEQTLVLRELNRRLGDRLPLPGPYTVVGKQLLAHDVLAARPGTKLVLGGEDLDYARSWSAEIVAHLRALAPSVHGDLSELLVPDDLDAPEVSSARQKVSVETLLAETLDATADLMVRVGERIDRDAEQQRRLRTRVGELRRGLPVEPARTVAVGDRVARRAARRVRTAAGAVRRRLRGTPPPEPPRTDRRPAPIVVSERRRPGPKIWLLSFNATGSGGVARTVANLANELARTHDVGVVSVYKAHPEPLFPLDPAIDLVFLAPYSWSAKRPPRRFTDLGTAPSVLPTRDHYSALTDLRLQEMFALIAPGDVLITTRPSLHPAPDILGIDPGVVRIGWDHLNFPRRYSQAEEGRGTGLLIDRARPHLDALVVLTEADAVDYADRAPGRVEVIRNSASWERAEEPGPHDEKVLVAAGRLTAVKGFDRLIDAWAQVQDEFPDWTCRIYGQGSDGPELKAQAERLGARVELPGYTDDMRAVLRDAACFVMSSRNEGFPMSLIEAQTEGAPIITFDCPRGPGEIVDDGRTGFLVPDGDIAGLADAMRKMMADPALRARMSREAFADAEAYATTQIAADWTRLIEELVEERGRRG